MNILSSLVQRFRRNPLADEQPEEDESAWVAAHYANRERLSKEGYRNVLLDFPPTFDEVQFERENGQRFVGRLADFAPEANIAGLWWKPLPANPPPA